MRKNKIKNYCHTELIEVDSFNGKNITSKSLFEGLRVTDLLFPNSLLWRGLQKRISILMNKYFFVSPLKKGEQGGFEIIVNAPAIIRGISSLILLIILLQSSAFAFDFHLAKTSQDTAKMYSGLASNGVTNIAKQGTLTIWFGTGRGLSRTDDFGESFVGYYSGEEVLPYGSITGLSVLGDVVWVAGVADDDSTGEQKGTGLAVSQDAGVTWEYIAQPIDDRYDTTDVWAGNIVRLLPVTTDINNTTWDVATTADYTYIVSWAGGLRRTADFGQTWQRVPLPADDETTLGNEIIDYQINPRDPGNGGNHNHKGFSVIAYGDTVWVGTANGINRGIVTDDYIEWTKFNSQNSSISGNFVVGLHRQYFQGKETIWAVTLPADNAGEYQAVSKSTDGGLNWSTVLENERAYAINSYDSLVFVATQNGLYKSNDGENWAIYRPSTSSGGDMILDDGVYESMVDTRTGTPMLWIGTSDGIAKKELNQADWSIYRAVLSTKNENQPMFYAYPNPFSPTHQNQLNGEGHVRFQYDLESPADITLEIFTFAMERIYKEKLYVTTLGDNSLIWNGRTDNGNYAANGTYFCKLTKKSDNKTSTGWTKLILIK